MFFLKRTKIPGGGVLEVGGTTSTGFGQQFPIISVVIIFLGEVVCVVASK